MNRSATTTDEYIDSLPTWQQDNLQLFRGVIHEVFPEITEEIKWGVPTFIDNKKILFAMSAFQKHTKFNFIYNGAVLNDINTLFNNGLESKKSRAIDLREGETVAREQLLELVTQVNQ